MSLAQLHDPASVAAQGKELFGRTMEMGDGMNIFTDFLTLATILLAGVIILVAFFVLALQIFVQLIAFKLGLARRIHCAAVGRFLRHRLGC